MQTGLRDVAPELQEGSNEDRAQRGGLNPVLSRWKYRLEGLGGLLNRGLLSSIVCYVTDSYFGAAEYMNKTSK